MIEERRVRGVVLEVVREVLRARGSRGLVLGAPPSPEGGLLARWCDGEVPLVLLDPAHVEPVERVLANGRDEAWMAAARVLGAREGLLPVHAANKLQLLLGPVPPAPLYPLGDLWPGDLTSWAGGASLPPVVAALDTGAAAELEERLRRGLEGGAGVPRALSGTPPHLARGVQEALALGRAASRPPVVPKLTAWTLGVDPAP